jgi:DNA-binding transcriptional LysR family regulator
VLVIASSDHPLARAPEVRAVDLVGEPILLTEPGCNYRNLFEHALIADGVYPASNLEFGSIETIKQCVMARMGIAVLPAVAVAAEIAQGRLVALNWSARPIEVVTQIVWHKDKWLSPALRAFIDAARTAGGLTGTQMNTDEDGWDAD